MFLAILDPITVLLLDNAQRGATNVLAGWVDSNNCEALFRQWEPVEAAIDELIDEVGDHVDVEDLARHCKFITRELRRKDKKACTSDIVDIATRDLYEIRKKLEKQAEAGIAYDRALLDATGDQLEECKFEDAIRAAMLQLTKRLRKLAGPTSTRDDGWKLVEALYGTTGMLRPAIGDKTSDALEHLLKGFYSAFRNRHMHHLPDIDAPEAVGVTLVIHYLLKEVVKPKSKWTVTP